MRLINDKWINLHYIISLQSFTVSCYHLFQSSEAIQELMTKELGGEGEDDDDDDDNEMTEDVVFSLLLSFRD